MVAAGATRAEMVADRIRQAIRAGVYVSGDRLIELTLAHQMQVSQNTVRDALRLLEAEGWVVKQSRHGVYIRTFSREEVIELYALWAAVESLAVRWAIEQISKKDTTHLRRILANGQREALAGDLQTAMEAVLEFHTMIGTLSAKPQTEALLRSLHNRVSLLEVLRQMRAPRSLRAHEARLMLYEKLVSLMEAGDGDAAEELLRYLIRTEGESLISLIE
ncbi:MAG: GntR family transcriptional regulator [Anaerolineae bacterium]|nr:GntR family transcriptional regulator [Anaerolineae bacterium]